MQVAAGQPGRFHETCQLRSASRPAKAAPPVRAGWFGWSQEAEYATHSYVVLNRLRNRTRERWSVQYAGCAVDSGQCVGQPHAAGQTDSVTAPAYVALPGVAGPAYEKEYGHFNAARQAALHALRIEGKMATSLIRILQLPQDQ